MSAPMKGTAESFVDSITTRSYDFDCVGRGRPKEARRCRWAGSRLGVSEEDRGRAPEGQEGDRAPAEPVRTFGRLFLRIFFLFLVEFIP